MKKILLAILSILYLGVSTGFTMHAHYCMDKLVETNLRQSDKDECGNCGMNKKSKAKKHCCSDEQKTVKLQSDQQVAKIAFNFEQFAGLATIPSYIELPGFHLVSTVKGLPLSHAPPEGKSVPTYILNRVIRI